MRAVSEATSLSTRDVSWAVGAVSSRAMKNDVSRARNAVVPGCDLLDHASSPNCVVRRRDDDKSSPSVVVETTRDVAAGERLTISCGRSLCSDRSVAHAPSFAPTNSSSTIPETFSFEDSGRFSASIRRTTRSRRACVKSPRAARATPETHGPPAAWSRSEDIASAKSVDVDDLWMRRVAVLRRGQAEIIDAYVRAFK